VNSPPGQLAATETPPRLVVAPLPASTVPGAVTVAAVGAAPTFCEGSVS
jgi:hypothetical protein